MARIIRSSRGFRFCCAPTCRRPIAARRGPSSSPTWRVRACPSTSSPPSTLREELKEQIRREIAAGSDAAEAVIRRLVPLSNGFGYRDLAPGDAIPIPRFYARGGGECLLDIGSSWGRWTIAAARAGFRAVGLDPMLGPLMAAKRFAAKQRCRRRLHLRRCPLSAVCRRRVRSRIFLQHPATLFRSGLRSGARRNCPRAWTGGFQHRADGALGRRALAVAPGPPRF